LIIVIILAAVGIFLAIYFGAIVKDCVSNLV